MKIKRLAASMVAVVTAVVGLSVVYAGPAAAAVGTWRAYGNTSPPSVGSATWNCGTTTPIETNVYAQACGIRSSSGLEVQVAVIVRNRRSSLYGAEAAVQMDRGGSGGRWECPRSGVAAMSWSVCFGQTVVQDNPVSVLDAGVNGTYVSTLGTTV